MSSQCPTPSFHTWWVQLCISCRGARPAELPNVINYGNIIAIIVTTPLGMLWLGTSMMVYAMNRHHPNEKVGHYTQQAAYRFYTVTGFFVAAATFIPGSGWQYYLLAWALAALILIPWSIVELVRIRKDRWDDLEMEMNEHEHASH